MSAGTQYKVMVETASGTIARAPQSYDDKSKAEMLAFLLPRNSNAKRAWVEEDDGTFDDPIFNLNR